MQMSEIFGRLTGSDWWEAVANEFLSVVRRCASDGVWVFYNADADGFTASYFVLAVIDALTRPQPVNIQTRAVWNYEYDFGWLVDFAGLNKPGLVICVDIPIIQEPDVLREVSSTCDVLIYDHHVPPEGISEIRRVFYANSRLLEGNDVDCPASLFAAALAFHAGAAGVVDMPVLACGLCGDNCLHTNKEIVEFLWRQFPALLDDRLLSRPLINRITSRVNALFRAKPGGSPVDAQRQMYLLMRSCAAEVAFAQFCLRYKLDEAQQLVTNEVQPALEFLRAVEPSKEGLLCEVLDFRTFSVGIVASVLAAEDHAPVVALGFKAGDKVQFEMRTSRKNKINLTGLLKAQRRSFTPVSSGGHPKAAGALLRIADVSKFKDSLQKALVEIL